MIEMITIIFISLLVFILLSPNAIHALLALILIFINFAMLLFYLDVLFLAFSYILVYIGAICVLFLYIILLLHLRIFSVIHKTNFLIISALLSFSALAIFSYHSLSSLFIPGFHTFMIDINLLASFLFVTHPIYLMFAMFLLLLALLLSIFLTTSLNTSFLLNDSITHLSYKRFFNKTPVKRTLTSRYSTSFQDRNHPTYKIGRLRNNLSYQVIVLQYKDEIIAIAIVDFVYKNKQEDIIIQENEELLNTKTTSFNRMQENETLHNYELKSFNLTKQFYVRSIYPLNVKTEDFTVENIYTQSSIIEKLELLSSHKYKPIPYNLEKHDIHIL